MGDDVMGYEDNAPFVSHSNKSIFHDFPNIVDFYPKMEQQNGWHLQSPFNTYVSHLFGQTLRIVNRYSHAC